MTDERDTFGVSDDVISVRALIRLLPASESGKTRPVTGGWRPNHNFFAPDSVEMTIGAIDLPDGVELRPGEESECLVDFWRWSGLDGRIHPGREWRIQEGRQLVGIGVVIELFS